MAKRNKKRKPYKLERFKATLSTCLRELERIILTCDEDDYDSIIRAANSLSTLANSYRNLTEATDLEERLTELENKLLNK